MRILSAFLLIFALAGCNRSGQSNEAIRQAIMDHLKAGGFKVDVNLTSVQVNGDNADASVSIVPPGGTAAQGMVMNYKLERQSGKWAVVGRNDAPGSPHSGAMPPAGGAMPGGENPHGGGAMPGGMPAATGAQGGSPMPSPESLPPAGQKK